MSEKHKPALAIIGSGVAGLTCATALSDRYDVSIFEKSRGLSGRMSTRRADNHKFDHGAQYFRARDADFKRWLAPLSLAGHVHEWRARAVHYCAEGAANEAADDEAKLVFAPSMNMIGKTLIAGRPQIKAYLDCQIEAIIGGPQAWRLQTGADGFGPFEHVVLAIPAAQAQALLPGEVSFAASLAGVKMIGCHTLMLGFAESEAALPDWDCAFFDDDMLGFAAVNSRKPMRTGGDALVVQTRHDWSEARIEDDVEEVAQHIKQRFAAITGLPTKPSSVSTDYDRIHRWRYASTLNPAGRSHLIDDAMGLSAIGDWCTGSKVEDAFRSGYALAQHLGEQLND